jgi:hypothetical protein
VLADIGTRCPSGSRSWSCPPLGKADGLLFRGASPRCGSGSTRGAARGGFPRRCCTRPGPLPVSAACRAAGRPPSGSRRSPAGGLIRIGDVAIHLLSHGERYACVACPCKIRIGADAPAITAGPSWNLWPASTNASSPSTLRNRWI